LVDEYGRCVGEDNVAVVRHGQFRIDHFQTPELAANLGCVGKVLFAELGGIPVCYECYGAKVVVLLALGLTLYAQNLARVSVLHNVGDGAFDDGDVWSRLGSGAQFRDEFAMVEGAALGPL
jgi:hypothetical protein